MKSQDRIMLDVEAQDDYCKSGCADFDCLTHFVFVGVRANGAECFALGEFSEHGYMTAVVERIDGKWGNLDHCWHKIEKPYLPGQDEDSDAIKAKIAEDVKRRRSASSD